MLLGVDGISDFNGLHSRRHGSEVEFYAVDMLVSDSEDLRKLPLSMRKTNLARLLARRVGSRNMRSLKRYDTDGPPASPGGLFVPRVWRQSEACFAADRRWGRGSDAKGRT